MSLAPKQSAATIEFKNTFYRLDSGQTIIDNLNFSIMAGETLVLLGRSGSGKTTTLKLINSLHVPSSGRVIVEGKSTDNWNPIQLRRQIGYVIQEVGLFPHFTVEQNVGLVPTLNNWSPNRIRERVREMLELVGLQSELFLQRFPDELSGGQRQRVGVARALAADPAFLLMDEPFGALDPITRNEIRKEFSQLQKRLKKTIVFVTHDVNEAFLLADRIGLMEKGKLVALAEAEEFRAIENPEVRAFLESSS